MVKTGDTLIFFPAPHNVNSGNNGKRICAAIAMGHYGSGRGTDEELDLSVFWDANGMGNPITMPGCKHAPSLQVALTTGEMWATIAEVQLWGIDLSNGDQDIPALLS